MTHLFEPGLEVHYDGALRVGAMKEEIVDVGLLAVNLQLQSLTLVFPILREELAARETTVSSDKS